MPQVPVEIRPVIDPEGRHAVLLQLPNGYVVMQPAGAREIAQMLADTADEVESNSS